MRRIQVKSVIEGPTRIDPSIIKKSVETVDGEKMSAFRVGKKGPTPGYDLIVQGAVLEVKIYDSGKYKNIDHAEAVEVTPEERKQVDAVVQIAKAESLGDREKNSYIVRESCLSSAIAMAQVRASMATSGESSIFRTNTVLLEASIFEQWVLGKYHAVQVKPPVPAPLPNPTPEGPDAPISQPTTPTIKTRGELWTKCNKAGYKLLDCFRVLDIKDTKDFTGNLDEAWAKIDRELSVQ